ncbi:integrase, catalytic region, zinc finger, CCHC-type containing protein [Tanacetum coccineum]
MEIKLKDPIAIEKKQNVRTIDYNKLNALYEDFVSQKELSAKQKYFSSTFISSENHSNASTTTAPSETKPSVASMPSPNLMKLYLEKMKNEFTTLFALIQTNSKRESIFYTTPEEKWLTKFCQQKVKPILHELHLNFEIFQKRFSKDIKEMKDVFESTKNELSATWEQNEFLNNQLLEAKLKYEIECCVLLCHECVNNIVQDEIEKIQRDSIEIQEGMQKRINILENDHVNQKTYAYAEVHAQNQDLLITISELKVKLKNVEKGLKVASSVRGPLNKDSSFKNSALSNTMKSPERVEASDRKNKKPNVASKNVVLNKKIITDADVKNALKAKDVLCVSCAKNVLIPCHDKCLENYKLNVVQIVLWIVDSGCSKHMTGDRSLLKIFVKKFLGTVRFGNDHFAAITCYGNYVQGNITVCHVYYVEGLGHNLFSVGQFCDGDLEVAFRSKICYVRNLEGDDLLIGAREPNLYTISISDMAASSPVSLMSKATSTKSWLWHRRLSHLNFGTINCLTKHDLVDGLSKFKHSRDHLCSACKRGKSKKSSHQPKLVPSTHSKLELLHMDLCGPMRVATINGNKYILVIVDDYS